MKVNRIISGGQTGVDRMGLDFAIENGIAHGGWCPAGRLAEDGKVPDEYQLKECPSDDYRFRTWLNVIDSDATVVFTGVEKLTGGSKHTYDAAVAACKPVLHIHVRMGADNAAEQLLEFLTLLPVETLNVAGPRASKLWGNLLRHFVFEVLGRVFSNSAI